MVVNQKIVPKKVISLIIIVLGVGLIVTLSRDILHLLGADDRIHQAQLKVEELAQENLKLKELKEYYQSEEFIEEHARNKLNLAREGETIVILPPNVEELVGFKEEKKPPQIPTWKKWWQLFF